MLSFIGNKNMLMVILFIFLSIGVPIINGDTCFCCFPWLARQCQPIGFEVLCTDCTSFFCAQHVKGCQGSPCAAECQSTSTSTTTTTISSSSTTTPMISSSSTNIPNGGCIIRIGLFIISFMLTLLILV